MSPEPPEITPADLWQNRIVGAVLGVTAVLVPVVLMPSGWDAWRFPKVLVVRAAAILLLAIYAIALVWSPRPLRKIRDAVRDRLTQVGLFIIIWIGISAIFSPQPSVSWWAWGDVVAGLTLFYSARSHVKNTGSRWLLWLMLVPACVNCVVIVLQHYDLWHPMVDSLRDVPWQEARILRRAALLGNRDDAGLYLVVPCLLALYLSLKPSRLEKRLVTGGIFVALGAGILLTTTITAIVAASLAGWLFLVIYMRQQDVKVVARVTILIVIPVLCLVVLTMHRETSKRLGKYRQSIEEGDPEAASGGRLLSFASAGLIALENPLFGAGPGMFPIVQVGYAKELRIAKPGIFTNEGEYWFDMAHNDFLEAGAEGGLPAAIAVLVFGWTYVRIALEVDGGLEGALALSLAAALVAEMLILFPLQLAGVYGTFAIAGGASLPR